MLYAAYLRHMAELVMQVIYRQMNPGLRAVSPFRLRAATAVRHRAQPSKRQRALADAKRLLESISLSGRSSGLLIPLFPLF